MIDPITSLPYELTAEILTNWLRLESVVHLDTAYCRRSVRHQFLQMLSWRRFSLSTITKSKAAFLLWMTARGIKVSRLVCTDILCMAEVSRSVKKSTNLRMVVLNGLNTTDARGLMAVLAYHCKNIRVLRVVSCSLDKSLRDILDVSLLCMPADAISADPICCRKDLPTDISLTVLTSYHALSLQVLHIRGCRLFSISGVISVVKLCPNLHTLCVDDETNSQFALTSGFMECVANHPCLKTLLICGVYLSAMTFHSLGLHGHTLQVLGLNGMCAHEHIVQLLEKCTSLHTLYLSYSTFLDEVEEGEEVEEVEEEGGEGEEEGEEGEGGAATGSTTIEQLRTDYPQVHIATGAHVRNVFAFNPFIYPTYLEELM